MALVGTSKLLKHSDASAPSISWSAGALITVLKAALVDGYGTKQSLGWTLEFEDAGNHVAVFKMGGGTRKYIRVDDSGTIFSSIEVYSTMTDANTGSEPLLTSMDSRYIYKNFSWTSYIYFSVDSWHIIGDDSGFWLHIGTKEAISPGYSPASQIVYIGDYNSIDPSFSETMCTCLSREVYSGTAYRWPTAMSIENTNSISLMNNIDSGYDPHWGNLYSVQSGLFGNNTKINGSNLIMYGYPIMVRSGLTVMGQLPGATNMFNLFEYSAAVSTQEEFLNERLAIIVQDANFNDLAFSCILGKSNNITQYASDRVPSISTNTQRITIRVGEGFRNVY